MTAFVYVRKSVMTDDRTLSPEVQEARLRSLAAAHDDDHVEVLRDLDISGTKVAERTGYVRLVEAIEAGDAHAVYAYDLSRLHRNVGESARFWKLVADRDVPVYLTDMTVDPRNATGRMIIGVFANINEWMSEVASEKIRASFAVKRANGEPLGGRRYGETRTIVSADKKSSRIVGAGDDPDAVIAAYRDTRTAVAAARRLNDAGVPTRNPSSRGWSPSAVESVVGHYAPELVRDRGESIRPTGDRPHRFSKLLRCGTCGATLTPATGLNGATRYYCAQARTKPHARTTVSEAAIAPAIRAAVDRTALAIRRVRRGEDGDIVDPADLAAKRDRYVEMYGEGLVTKAVRDAKLAEVADAERRAASSRWVRRFSLPPDVASDDATTVNTYLRRVFARFVVDMSSPGHRGKTIPVGASPEWINPDHAVAVEDLDDPDLASTTPRA